MGIEVVNVDAYFQHVVENLDVQDIQLLSTLSNEGATAKYKGLFHKVLLEKCEISEAKYRNVIIRLSAMRFIETNILSKEHSIFINSYGKKALQEILDK